MNLVVYRTEVIDLRACHRVCKRVQWRVLVSNISYFILALLPISLSVICQTHCPSARSINDNIARDILFIPVTNKAKILRRSSKASCGHSSIRLHILGRFRLVQLEGQLTEGASLAILCQIQLDGSWDGALGDWWKTSIR